MDEWFDNVRQQLEAIAANLEHQVNDAVEVMLEQSNRLAERIDQAIAPGLDQLDQWEMEVAERVEAWLPQAPVEALEDFEQRVDDWTVQTGEAIGKALQPIEQTVKPMLNNHQPCVSCRHYHGEAYGDSAEMLVCGMHPFGYEADTCPDWQSTWQQAE